MTELGGPSLSSFGLLVLSVAAGLSLARALPAGVSPFSLLSLALLPAVVLVIAVDALKASGDAATGAYGFLSLALAVAALCAGVLMAFGARHRDGGDVG